MMEASHLVPFPLLAPFLIIIIVIIALTLALTGLGLVYNVISNFNT